jgi:hypothetical protein
MAFDFALADPPPLLAAKDFLRLARMGDDACRSSNSAVLMVLLSERSKRQLGAVKTRFLGPFSIIVKCTSGLVQS